MHNTEDRVSAYALSLTEIVHGLDARGVVIQCHEEKIASPVVIAFAERAVAEANERGCVVRVRVASHLCILVSIADVSLLRVSQIHFTSPDSRFR